MKQNYHSNSATNVRLRTEINKSKLSNIELSIKYGVSIKTINKSKKEELCKKISKFDVACKENNVEHRCTKPFNPQTNGMVEKTNGIIKSKTIKQTKYNSLEQMNDDLMNFLVHYNLYRRHGSLRKELT